MVDLLPEFPSNFAHATYIGGRARFLGRGEKWREKGVVQRNLATFQAGIPVLRSLARV